MVGTIQGKDIGLFNAMDNACLHQGVSLGTSQLDGKIVTCRGHDWKHGVTIGSTLNSPGYGIAAYPGKFSTGR
jgi:nitrite reductase/ring-hydroxylating ferredoxin subunit